MAKPRRAKTEKAWCRTCRAESFHRLHGALRRCFTCGADPFAPPAGVQGPLDRYSPETADLFESVPQGSPAEIAREAAIQTAGRGMSEEQRGAMLEGLRKLCETRPSFWANEVWDVVPPELHPETKSAIGGLVREAYKRGWCKPAGGGYTESTSSHSSRVRWDSLLFRGER